MVGENQTDKGWSSPMLGLDLVLFKLYSGVVTSLIGRVVSDSRSSTVYVAVSTYFYLTDHKEQTSYDGKCELELLR